MGIKEQTAWVRRGESMVTVASKLKHRRSATDPLGRGSGDGGVRNLGGKRKRKLTCLLSPRWTRIHKAKTKHKLSVRSQCHTGDVATEFETE